MPDQRSIIAETFHPQTTKKKCVSATKAVGSHPHICSHYMRPMSSGGLTLDHIVNKTLLRMTKESAVCHKMSSDQVFHKPKFPKTVKKAKAKCRECRQVRNLNLHKLYNGQTLKEQVQKKQQTMKFRHKNQRKKHEMYPAIFCVKSWNIYAIITKAWDCERVAIKRLTR